MAKGGHSHRSTQKNDHKPFKSKHATKGQLKNMVKGKVETETTKPTKNLNKTISKLERKNLSKQLKGNKIAESKIARKLFDGSLGTEKIITIIALTKDITPQSIANDLINAVIEQDQQETYAFDLPSVTAVKINRFKSNLKVIIPDQDDILSVLDAAKVSDIVIFGISANEEVDKEYGEQILRGVVAQGIASVMGVLPNVASAYPKRNLQLDIRQSLQSFFNHFFPAEEKMHSLEIESERANCLRTICQKFPKSVNWRDNRGYLVADSVYWSTSDPAQGSLVVEGTVRGLGFNADKLIHIPGYGDFQIDKIEKSTRTENSEFIPTFNQESLEELKPETEDMEEDDFEHENPLGVNMADKKYFTDERDLKQVKKFTLPKGTSDYQGKWFVDDVLEDASDVEEVDSDEAMEYDDDLNINRAPHTETEYAPTEFGETEMHVDLAPDEEERQLSEYRQLESEDREFPDELELHPRESGKERLAAFRGIKNLGNCTWDHDEEDIEAPSVWNRLLRISNFKATKNRVVKECIREAQVSVGTKVKMFIRAPALLLERIQADKVPFSIYGLLQHEHKLAVCNFSFESWEDFEEPIPSRESIIVQYGPRRQVINPIFNQASNNSNNVHKSENFAHQGNLVIATAIAPVLFYNAPAIYFKMKEDGKVEFIGQGTFLNCDHTRIVAQRAVLTGHPVKIHKRVVTVRYMFFNTSDIKWFKAIPLFTKSGRTGFIKESLGTHGYFKANFDGKLTSQDTVAMSMYKRVWPEMSIGWSN